MYIYIGLVELYSLNNPGKESVGLEEIVSVSLSADYEENNLMTQSAITLSLRSGGGGIEEKAKVVTAVWGTEFIQFSCRVGYFTLGLFEE